MPAFIALIIQGLTAAMAAAPKAIELVKHGKDLFSALFGAGLITKAQQDTLHAHVDAISESLLRGDIPPGWEVRPDPQS